MFFLFILLFFFHKRSVVLVFNHDWFFFCVSKKNLACSNTRTEESWNNLHEVSATETDVLQKSCRLAEIRAKYYVAEVIGFPISHLDLGIMIEEGFFGRIWFGRSCPWKNVWAYIGFNIIQLNSLVVSNCMRVCVFQMGPRTILKTRTWDLWVTTLLQGWKETWISSEGLFFRVSFLKQPNRNSTRGSKNVLHTAAHFSRRLGHREIEMKQYLWSLRFGFLMPASNI